MTTTTMAKQSPLGGRLPLYLGLTLGAIAAGLAIAFLASRDTESPAVSAADVELVEVVVAQREIPVGTKLTTDDIKVKLIPANAVISDPFDSVDDVLGTVTRYPLQANEQLAVGRLVDEAKGTSISFQIPPGLRGFTIPVGTATSPAGLMAPGDFVDIIVSASVKNIVPQSGVPIPASADTDFKAAVTLLQNVQVISVERKYVNNGIVYDQTTRGTPVDSDVNVDNVTLAVTPEQAQLLWLASQEGKITLSLRPFGENNVTPLQPAAEPIRIN